ncbi:MAG: hypothetical protein ACYC0M_10575 [Burkholderiales bacterium]
MSKLENIEEVAQELGDGSPFNPDADFETVGDVVKALVDLGNTDKVFARHDDHQGLESDLSEAFLKSPLSDIEKSEFESDIKAVLEQANIIIPLSKRELSKNDIEEIREDKISRGQDPDD